MTTNIFVYIKTSKLNYSNSHMEGHKLLQQYKPKSVKEFIGNATQIEEIRKFLMDDGMSSLIVIGPSGSGKTTLVNLLVEECGTKYSLINPEYDVFNNHKEFESYIDNLLYTTSILSMMNKNIKLVFFDDADILMSHDRYANNYIQEVLNKNMKNRSLKFIITASSTKEQRLTDIKKKVKYIVRIENPPLNDVVSYTESILSSNGYEYTHKEVIDLVSQLQCNVRNTLMNLTNFESSAESNYHDKNIYEIVQKIFERSNEDLRDLDIAISSDPCLISYMLYDNYKQVCPEANHKLINEKFICSSIFEDYAYKSNDWTLVELANLLRCGAIRCELKKHNVVIAKNMQIQYTQITTRAAQQYNNNKLINQYLAENNLSTCNYMGLAMCKPKKVKGKKATVLSIYASNIL